VDGKFRIDRLWRPIKGVQRVCGKGVGTKAVW